ncbi:hypothetical protein P168DRAFT_152609 [Aspergillus campestris IBT 28561]|uniref:Uncharacterized protein n=1 Tax=Aspergillus campestris (strain IBT 28561) TaxID=1392248 RepID=A0A2I1D2M6_ASPC2|nr:uncharacterized protein P168DRAFT_152609 [Aspergillus campestris IBT 28561]PKY04133.1 hypothetical protein P168DRAFT_152609 [Aspergillus campestris IBT 28561]
MATEESRVLDHQPGRIFDRDRDHRTQRVRNYIDNVVLDSGSDIDVATPSSCPSLSTVSDMDPSQCTPSQSTQSKDYCHSDEIAYKIGLSSRNVNVDPGVVQSFVKPEFLNDRPASLFIPKDIQGSLKSAVAVRDTAINESTYVFIMTPLIIDWLVDLPHLKFASSVQWETEHLEILGVPHDYSACLSQKLPLRSTGSRYCKTKMTVHCL